jgi:nucleotide-binding universal stress UspA family protein
METIVVGVDGSEGAAAALDFAAAEAALRRARLRLVAAWEIPVAAYGAGFAPPLDAETLDAFRVRAQQVAYESLATIKKLQPSSKRRRSPSKVSRQRSCSRRRPTQR